MHIDIRLCHAAADDFRRALDRRREPGQGLRHLDDDPRAAPGQERHIPEELDGVAQPLLVMQKDRLAGNVLAAPERPREILRLVERVLPAPLVSGPALFQIAGGKQRQGSVPGGVDKLRLQRHGSVAARDRRREPVAVQQRHAKIAVRLGAGGVVRDRALKARDRFVSAVAQQQQDAKIGQRLGVLELEGAGVAFLGLREAAAMLLAQRQHAEGRGEDRTRGGGSLISFDRRVEIA